MKLIVGFMDKGNSIIYQIKKNNLKRNAISHDLQTSIKSESALDSHISSSILARFLNMSSSNRSRKISYCSYESFPSFSKYTHTISDTKMENEEKSTALPSAIEINHMKNEFRNLTHLML